MACSSCGSKKKAQRNASANSFVARGGRATGSGSSVSRNVGTRSGTARSGRSANSTFLSRRRSRR